MFAAESYISRHYIAIVAMACPCVLLGGPSCAAGAESLFIAGATYREPGVSGPGWSWTDAGHLELDGYAGDAIGAGGDLVVTLVGQNSVTESHAPDADITQCGMEVWGDLTLRGTGSLAASGSQCAIHVSQALAVEGCAVDARADGANVTDEAVAGLIAGGMAVRGGGRVAAVGTAPAAGARAYGVYLQGAGAGVGSAGCTLSVDASWLDATGTDGGVACTSGSLVHARFVTPAGGAFGAGGVVDASGAMAPHVVIEPEDTTAPAGGDRRRGRAGRRCRSCRRAARCRVRDRSRPEARDCADQDDHDNRNDGDQDHGARAIQGQDRQRCHRHAPQDSRQQLDRRLLGATPAGNSACVC